MPAQQNENPNNAQLTESDHLSVYSEDPAVYLNPTSSLTSNLNLADDSKALRIATLILEAFNKHYRIFLRITREAHTRFIQADWEGEYQSSSIRIKLYTKRVTEAADQLRAEYLNVADEGLWHKVKLLYIGLLYEHRQPELAETFYNSVFTWLFDRRYYNNSNIFVRPSVSTKYLTTDSPAYFSFYPMKEGVENTIRAVLNKFNVGLPFENLNRDVTYLVHALNKGLISQKKQRDSNQLQVISSLFYRSKAAYIIGRTFNGQTYSPFAIPLINNEDKENPGIYVDAIVFDKRDIHNLFSFSRSYFMVDTVIPSAIITFLKLMLPRKTTAELYTAIGLQKQGKSDFYRNFLYHLSHSSDQFKISSGIKGMVMSVFTLPSYPFVFKVINDRFAPPKEVTRKVVKQKYQMVKMHDRVGRMADTLEFSHVSFPLERFSDDLLAELRKKISKSLKIEGGQLIIRHLYIERRLQPLNLYLQKAKGKLLENAIIEYGNAIKELAAANIFPGDLLTKNFGITRHGRVIFYDYDEIELLVDVNFRKIPAPRRPEDIMASEPWYSIAPLDVFPEEFLPFLLSDMQHRKIFLKHHKDLLDADFWKSIQDNIRHGLFTHVYPYSQKIRFLNKYPRDNETQET